MWKENAQETNKNTEEKKSRVQRIRKKTIKLVNPVIMQCPHHHHHSQTTNSIVAPCCLMPGCGIPGKIHTNTCMKMWHWWEFRELIHSFRWIRAYWLGFSRKINFNSPCIQKRSIQIIQDPFQNPIRCKMKAILEIFLMNFLSNKMVSIRMGGWPPPVISWWVYKPWNNPHYPLVN